MRPCLISFSIRQIRTSAPQCRNRQATLRLRTVAEMSANPNILSGPDVIRNIHKRKTLLALLQRTNDLRRKSTLRKVRRTFHVKQHRKLIQLLLNSFINRHFKNLKLSIHFLSGRSFLPPLGQFADQSPLLLRAEFRPAPDFFKRPATPYTHSLVIECTNAHAGRHWSKGSVHDCPAQRRLCSSKCSGNPAWCGAMN